MSIIISGDRNYGGTKIWGFFSEIQKFSTKFQKFSAKIWGFFPIFSKNPRISYHINMSRKVIILIQCFTHIMSKTFYIYDYHDN